MAQRRRAQVLGKSCIGNPPLSGGTPEAIGKKRFLASQPAANQFRINWRRISLTLNADLTDCERRYRSENRDHEYRRDRASRVWSPSGEAHRSRLTVSVGPDPSDVPVVQAVDLVTALAGLLHSFALGDFIGRYDWRSRISLSRFRDTEGVCPAQQRMQDQLGKLLLSVRRTHTGITLNRGVGARRTRARANPIWSLLRLST